MFIKKELLLETEMNLTKFIEVAEFNPEYAEAVATAIELRLTIQKELVGRR